ncbi:MAG: hypothetical protein ACR2ML_00990, partial [Solirubrobacteraceae bacterium]
AELRRQQALELSHLSFRLSSAAAFVAAALMLALALAPAAGAQTPGSTRGAVATERQASVATADPNGLTSPATLSEPPSGHVLSARGARAIAGAVPKIRAERRRLGKGVSSRAFLKGNTRWQVSYYKGGKEVGQVLIEDRTGRVLEAWTGFQVAWSMARGYPGAFGRKVGAWYVWIPLCVLFVAPFVDLRRPFRLLHLDLVVLVGWLSASLAFFNHGNIGVSVPLALPPLVYLLVRMLLAAFRPRAPATPARLLVPWTWLIVATVFLVGFRVALNVADGNVIDVGYSGVIGADRLMDGDALYGGFPKDDEHGDTYGPVNYYAYVPFEQAMPWSGRWDDLPAAHGAAIAFDLLTLVALFLLGRRVRGPTMGAALAYAWAACPFTLLVSNSGANDSLVAFLVALALLAAVPPPPAAEAGARPRKALAALARLAAASSAARGATIALAAMTKLAPIVLAPLLATYAHGRRSLAPRRLLAFTLGLAATLALVLAPVLLAGDLGTFYDRTLSYQNDRGSPFSVWGYYGGLGGLQTAVKIGAAALAVLVALVPRRRDPRVLAALAAAVIIAMQIGITHWFYLYVVWFLPPLLLVLLAPPQAPAPLAATPLAPPDAREPAREPEQLPQPAPA